MAKYTQIQLDQLREAIAAGTLSVTTDKGTVQYRSLADMRQVEKMMVADLAAQTSTKRVRRVFVSTSKGLGRC